MTAAEWLDAVSVSRNVLVTVGNVRETLVDWVRVGATTAYSVTWLSQTHPGEARSAYRRLTGVRINDTALTERASLASVQANASSWFWDSATSTLYVSSSTGANPSTFSWTGAVFELFFSTTAIADDVMWEPRVVGALPTLSAEEYDLTLGVSSSASGTLTLTNGDGFFDDTAWRYAWHNATVAIAVGGGEMAIADYPAVGQLQIAGAPAPQNDVCTFELRAFDNQTRNRAFPLTLYSDDPTMAAALPAASPLATQFMPMFWGRAYGIPAHYCYQTTNGLGAHIGHFCFVDVTLEAAAVLTTCYAINRATNVVSLASAHADTTISGGLLLVNVDIFPTTVYDFYVYATRSTELTVGAVASEILSLLGVPADKINATSFAACDAAWPATITLYVPGGAAPDVFVSAGELLRQLEQSCLGRIYVGDDGRWTMDIYDPSVPLSASVVPEELITAFAPTSQIQEPMAKSIRVQYQHIVLNDFWGDFWRSVSVSANAAAYEFQTTDVLTVAVPIVEEHYATLLAGRLAWINSVPTIRVVLDGPPVCFTLKPRDKVRVIRQRGPGATGSWADPGVGMEVEAVSKRPSDSRAEVTIGNMRGIGGAVKVAAPNGTPDWASASDLEKLIYGFGLDNDTERADVSDASTYQQMRAW